MLSALRRWWTRAASPATLGHDWRDGRPFVRVCTRCGVNNYLMERRFPRIGEAKYQWQKIWQVCGEKEWIEAERARLAKEGVIK